ncbi:transmembrane protein, putative [Actinidia rufa]|uniref:Transmembrane protein, putative n=1 Tax=Actinidia rufa TaxID=165716 RepID=A0A7J0H3V1_9ERIC|nr:transmembrane protein, putative [Actinidia rufa]
MQIFPSKLAKLWNKWELRATVVLSLFLQIILIGLGSRRKSNTKNWIRIILWLAYLLADWVATVSLGVLANNQGDSNSKDHNSPDSYVIMAFWAPFLLLHLGGPDTITAYSLEDNELWLRHLLGLVVQVGVALYVSVRALRPADLNFIAIPMFIAGIVKYGERTWILRSASSQHFRKSLLPRPDPGPNYSKFMEEYMLKETEGFELSWSVTQAPKVVAPDYAAGTNRLIPDAKILNAAHDFFLTFKRLFADLILSFQDLEKSASFFQENSWKDAFEVIGVELGFVYDVLYTKAAVIYSIWGGILRCTSLSSTVIAFMAFCAIDWHGYSPVDVSITFLLLVGAIGLEIYAILLLLSSDWTLFWLIKHDNKLVYLVYTVISSFKCIISKKKWSNCMAQYNLLNSCFKDKKTSTCCDILKWMGMNEILEKWPWETSKNVPSKLKESIFAQLVEKSKSASDFRVCKQLCSARGDRVLQNWNCLNDLGWSVEVEFDHSILLWHIATDLCYHSDKDNHPDKDHHSVKDRDLDSVFDPCEMSKLLSDYMLYILVKRPNMLPNGIGQIRFQDTCAEVLEFSQDKNCMSDERLACKKLLRVDVKIPPAEVKGDRSKSLLFDACKLAKALQSLQIEREWEMQQKWEMICHVWLEILSYAASQCMWNQHAQQLRRGGELLTHVWLLMAHLGITEQFQISQGHARTKLVVQ